MIFFRRRKGVKRRAYIEVDGIYFNYTIHEGEKLLIRSTDTSMNFIKGLCERVYGIGQNEMKIVINRRTVCQSRTARALSVR